MKKVLDLDLYQFEGELLKIYTYPHPVLAKKAEEVKEFNEELALLCKNMLYTMYESPGIGLAAPQIGKSLRFFVLDIDYDREKIVGPQGEERYEYSGFAPKIFINPVITKKEGQITYQEGCLSLPGIYEEVKRSEKIEVEYYDLEGKKHTLEADDLLSVCIQHEYDHLEGTVLLDRLGQLKRNLLKKKLMKQKKN